MRLKRLTVPKFWRVARKEKKWAVSPRPGPHRKFEAVPLQVLLRDVLGIVEKGKESRTIIKRGEVFVDGKVRKDHAYPVGLFDVIAIPATGKNYRAVPSKNILGFIEISDEEAKRKVCKIENKTVVGKGKMQLNLHDGKNILVDKKEFRTGDSLVLEIPSLKVIDHIPLQEGAVGIVTKGVDVGKTGKIIKVSWATSKEHAKVICDFDGKEEEVLKERFFVVGKDEPVIKLT